MRCAGLSAPTRSRSSPSTDSIAPWAIPGAIRDSRSSPTIASQATIRPVSSTSSGIPDASNCRYWPKRAEGSSPRSAFATVLGRKRRRLTRMFRPSRQISLRPSRQCTLAGDASFRPRQPFPRFVQPRRSDRGEQAEIDVHRLKRAGAGADRFDVAASDVIEKRPYSRCQRRGLKLKPEPFGGGEAADDQADRGAFDIALAAGDLAREAQAGRSLQAQTRVEQARRIEIGVPVHAAEAGELRPFEPRNHAEDAALLAVFELGLEADNVEQRAERIVLPELDHGIGFDLWVIRVGQPDRLHRSIAQGLAPAFGHDFDRQAAVEIGRALEF